MASTEQTTVFHVSDLHFGRPAVPEQIEAIEAIIQEDKFDVVAVSGDFSQRARSGEFQRAAVFLRDAQKVSKTIVVPGNHDVAWWRAPFGIGRPERLYENYQKFISSDLEPVLHVPGATFVGLNTSHGVILRTHRMCATSRSSVTSGESSSSAPRPPSPKRRWAMRESS